MPAPTSYTESSLIGFMEVELGPTGEALGLLTTDALQQAVYAVVRLLGTTIAAATDMAHLEAAARWKAWEAAESAAVSQFNVSLTGGKKFELETIFKQVQLKLSVVRSAWYVEKARVDAAAGGTGFFAFGLAAGCRGR
jgi:hypothetical protein